MATYLPECGWVEHLQIEAIARRKSQTIFRSPVFTSGKQRTKEGHAQDKHGPKDRFGVASGMGNCRSHLLRLRHHRQAEARRLTHHKSTLDGHRPESRKTWRRWRNTCPYGSPRASWGSSWVPRHTPWPTTTAGKPDGEEKICFMP